MKVEADLVVFNGNIVTMDPQNPQASALAVKSYKILAVGEEEEVLDLVPTARRVIDLGGKTVVPGFIDAHTHITSDGVRSRHPNLGTATSVDSALEMLQAALPNYRKNEWVLGFGYDESTWPERRYLTATDLDRVSTDNAIMATRIDGHLASVNTKGFEKLGIPEKTEGVDKDKKGRPTGILKDIEEVWDKIWPGPERIREGIKAGNDIANQHGITTVVDNAREGSLKHIREVEMERELTARMVVNIPVSQMNHLIKLGITSGMGSPMVRIGGVKVFTDGSIGAMTAAMSNDYKGAKGNKGRLLIAPKKYASIVKKAVANDIQLATHAIGDEAIEMVISTYEKLKDKERIRSQRHRIEHAEMINEYQIRRAVSLGLILSMQPNFVGRWQLEGGLYETRFDEERVRGMNMFRVALDNGARVCFGSDGMPYGPLYGIWAATTHPNDRVRLTVEEALRCYTMESAHSVFQENTLGSLTVGKRADFVVLSENLLRIPPERVKDIDIEMTVVGGLVEHSAPGP
jgi:predicted amidohydrolase YtcJ